MTDLQLQAQLVNFAFWATITYKQEFKTHIIQTDGCPLCMLQRSHTVCDDGVAFDSWTPGAYYIFVDGSASKDPLWVLAHELGHIQLTRSGKSNTEAEADKLAQQMLSEYRRDQTNGSTR